jgi:hypothetical protein
MGNINRTPKPNKRAGIVPRKSTSRRLKAMWRRARLGISLRQFAREYAGDLGADWLYNKRQNFSKSPLGIGRTRGRAVSGKAGRKGKG